MNRIFCLRYAFVSSLLIAILALAGSPIFCSDTADAAQEKQLTKPKKQAKHLRYERGKKARLKAARKWGPGKKPKSPFCWWWDWSCD
jgi:hypothetical protein